MERKRTSHLQTWILIILASVSLISITAYSKQLSDEDEKKYDLAFQSALARFEKANLLFDKKKYDETIKELNAVINIEFPDGTEDRDGLKMQLDAYSFLAEMQLDKKQPDKAVDTIKAGLKKAPDVSEQTYHLYMTLGHAYKGMKKTDEALDAFEKAQKINDILQKQKEEEESRKKQK